MPPQLTLLAAPAFMGFSQELHHPDTDDPQPMPLELQTTRTRLHRLQQPTAPPPPQRTPPKATARTLQQQPTRRLPPWSPRTRTQRRNDEAWLLLESAAGADIQMEVPESCSGRSHSCRLVGKAVVLPMPLFKEGCDLAVRFGGAHLRHSSSLAMIPHSPCNHPP